MNISHPQKTGDEETDEKCAKVCEKKRSVTIHDVISQKYRFCPQTAAETFCLRQNTHTHTINP